MKPAKRTYCFIRANERLKTAILYQMNGKGWTIGELARQSGVPNHRIGNYLNKEFEKAFSALTQQQLLAVCNTLGIEVELKIQIK